MSEEKPISKEQIKLIESTFPLKRIKVGTVIDEKLYSCIRFYLGEIIDKIPEPTALSIHFDSLGNAHTLNDDLIESITDEFGRDILIKPTGGGK